MKIKTIETQVEHIKLKKPFVTALRRVESVEFVRVSIVCDDWRFGIGEAPATKAITGEDIQAIINSISKVKERLIGLGIKEALDLLHTNIITSTMGSSAKAALDMALISLRAKEEDLTLLEYFKIEDLTPIKSDITISLNDEETMLCDAKDALKNSMNILKVKLGSDINHAVNVTKRLSFELSNATLIIDANQAWSKEAALFYIEEIQDVKIALIEQPVVAKDLESLQCITNASNIAILADEAAFTLEDVKHIMQTKSADMINIKLMKCGGITKAIEILEYAREEGFLCMLGSMLEGPYSINMAIYLAFAYRDVIKFVDLDSPLLYEQESYDLDFCFSGATISYIA